jgi:hypothetical protein
MRIHGLRAAVADDTDMGHSNLAPDSANGNPAYTLGRAYFQAAVFLFSLPASCVSPAAS